MILASIVFETLAA